MAGRVENFEGKLRGRPKGSKGRRSLLTPRMKQVAENLDNENFQPRSKLAKALWDWVRRSAKNREKFMLRVMVAEGEGEGEGEEKVAEPVLGLIDELLAEWKKEKQ